MQAIDKFTVAILGDQSVGKTSLLNRFVIDLFQEKYELTQGVDYISKTLTVANKPVRLQFFDICGNKQFISLISNYIKKQELLLFVIIQRVIYNLVQGKDENSLKNLPFWIEAIKKANDDKTLIYILGNKSDLQKNRKVDLQQAQLTALSFNAQQFEVSAKSNHNIKDAFQVIANDLCHQNLKTIEQQDKEKLFIVGIQFQLVRKYQFLLFTLQSCLIITNSIFIKHRSACINYYLNKLKKNLYFYCQDMPKIFIIQEFIKQLFFFILIFILVFFNQNHSIISNRQSSMDTYKKTFNMDQIRIHQGQQTFDEQISN